MAEHAEQISDSLVIDYIKKKDPTLGKKISKKWNAPELPVGSPDVKEVVTHFMKTTTKKRRESLDLLTPGKKSKKDKSTPKTNGVANGTPKSATNGHAKASESSSEDSSDDSEEPKKPVVAKKTPSKSPKVVRPTAPVQKDSSSEESSSEEEKPAAKKVVPAKATPKQAPKKESSSEDDSSDDEPAKKPQAKAPKVVKKIAAKKESSEEESSEESSDEEPPKPKAAPKQTPKVKAKPAAEKESSDDSDSSEEESDEPKKPLVKKVVPAKAPAKASESSSDEESSSEEEVKKPVVKKVSAKKESSDEDSSDEDEQPPKKVVKKAAKKESSSSSDDDSDSDDEEEEAKPVAAPVAAEKRKREPEGGAEFGNRQKFVKSDVAFNGNSNESESHEIFVNRIGQSMTEDSLYEHFKQFGSIERTKIATDRDTGESRGFAFVTFSSPSEAQSAVSFGFSHNIEGTSCAVRLAEPKPAAGQQKFGGNNSFGGNESGESKELFVNRLDYSFTDDHLFEYFKQFGTVERAKVATDRETGESRGFAFITFSAPEEAKAAVAKGPTHSIEGSEFCIRIAEPKNDAGGQRGGGRGGRGGGFRGGRGDGRGGGGFRGGRGDFRGGRGGSGANSLGLGGAGQNKKITF